MCDLHGLTPHHSISLSGLGLHDSPPIFFQYSVTTSSIYPHPLIKLLCNFSHHRTLLTFHSLKSLFSRHLCKNAFLASKPRPSPSIHYSFILPLYLPKKRRNYPKSLTVTLSTRNISLGNSMIASLFPQAPIPTF